MPDRYDEILTPRALSLIAVLDEAFESRRGQLLARRERRRAKLASGQEKLGFLPETVGVRAGDWTVAGAAPGLEDRRVEITGPPVRRMAAKALNSGAKVWMADFEDATVPTWPNLIEGQLVLRDIALGPEPPATVVVRPRGWHLDETHLPGGPFSGSLVDFALAATQGWRYFYLPKLENHLEARLWNDVFRLTEAFLGLERGAFRATVLIETITAAFEMDEILYELREHCAGLNAGRWDYLFSIAKTFPNTLLPDRSRLTMTVPFLRAYTDLLVRTCHRRGAYAIGGMSAYVPGRDNATAFTQVRQDKKREAAAGFDGSWVAHPRLVEICDGEFTRPDQLDVRGRDVRAAELLDLSGAGHEITEAGLRTNIAVTVRYLDAWLGGTGAVAIDGLMEDAATAEISRCQVWQWVRHEVFPRALVEQILHEETAGLAHSGPVFDLFVRTALGSTLPAFFTPSAYEMLSGALVA